MKQGKSINEVAQELERQAKYYKDFLAPTTQLHAMGDGDSIRLLGLGPKGEDYTNDDRIYDRFVENPVLTKHALRQIGSHQNIPAKYVDKMMDKAPQLLAENINHWFEKEPSVRLVRLNEHGVRAYLSDRYRIIDNMQIAEYVLPIISEHPDLEIISCDVTDSKLYIKAVTPKIKGEVVVGQEVQAGVTITNSEIGLSSVSVKPLAYFLWCKNGCTTDKGLSKYHIGKASNENDIHEILADDTLKADDTALMLKLRDVLIASLDQVQFDKSLNKFRTAQEIKIGNPMKAVELVEKRGWISKEEGASVLLHLIQGGDLSAFGMSSAITRTSQDIASYDRASQLEDLGGTIIELPKTAWTDLSIAA